MSNGPVDIVEKYQKAWAAHDLRTARTLLDDALLFEGPIDTFDNADDYIKALTQLAPVLKGATQKKVFVDGEDVMVISELDTTVAGAAPVAEWFRVKGDKIAEIRAYFDARPFAPPA